MSIIRIVVVVLVVACLSSPASAFASEWEIIPEESRLTFQGAMLGSPVTGVFECFSTDIKFDPEALAEASVTILIDMAAINTNHDERDLALSLPEWFSIMAFPEAHFFAQGFSQTGPNEYITQGILTIRGVSRQITLPFDLNIANGTARMTASLDLRRNDFDIGQGDWATDALVSYDVRIEMLIFARQVQ